MYILHQVSQIDHGQRHKVPSVSSIESVGSFGESKLDGSHIRHPSSMDLSHISRVQGETGSPAYTSPVTITPKLELPITVQKGPQGPNQMPLPSSASSQMRSDFKIDHTGLRSVDMVQLLTVCTLLFKLLFLFVFKFHQKFNRKHSLGSELDFSLWDLTVCFFVLWNVSQVYSFLAMYSLFFFFFFFFFFFVLSPAF